MGKSIVSKKSNIVSFKIWNTYKIDLIAERLPTMAVPYIY